LRGLSCGHLVMLMLIPGILAQFRSDQTTRLVLAQVPEPAVASGTARRGCDPENIAQPYVHEIPEVIPPRVTKRRHPAVPGSARRAQSFSECSASTGRP